MQFEGMFTGMVIRVSARAAIFGCLKPFLPEQLSGIVGP